MCAVPIRRGSESHQQRGVVSLNKTLNLNALYWSNPGKSLNMNKKKLTGVLSI